MVNDYVVLSWPSPNEVSQTFDPICWSVGHLHIRFIVHGIRGYTRIVEYITFISEINSPYFSNFRTCKMITYSHLSTLFQFHELYIIFHFEQNPRHWRQKLIDLVWNDPFHRAVQYFLFSKETRFISLLLSTPVTLLFLNIYTCTYMCVDKFTLQTLIYVTLLWLISLFHSNI